MTPDQQHPWETLGSRDLVHRPPWLRLWVDRVRLPNGRVVEEYHQIATPDYAVIFAQTSDGRIVAERMYKHGLRRVVLSLPAGMIEAKEEPLAAARRELLEETGYAADSWRYLGMFAADSNYGMGRAHLFSAAGARQVRQPHAGDLEEIDVLLVTMDELMAAVREGRVASLPNISAIALATHPHVSRMTPDGTAPAWPDRTTR
jgi:ADP-ribose pyrophosphatase